jgi:hypothetical protein
LWYADKQNRTIATDGNDPELREIAERGRESDGERHRYAPPSSIVATASFLPLGRLNEPATKNCAGRQGRTGCFADNLT